MKTKRTPNNTKQTTTSRPTTEQVKLSNQTIMEDDKARVTRYAEARRLKQEPLSVAQYVVEQLNCILVPRDLELHKSQLLTEVREIQCDMDIIK